MLRTSLVGFALVAVMLSAVAASTDAPADEYFGPFKYSAISVRTKITALGRSYRERWSPDDSIVHDAGLVESSFRVWAQKYPKDKWLAPTAFHLAQLYQEIQTNDARSKARAMFEFTAKNYPASKEAHLARLRLQQGFPALHDETPVSPTPSPYGPGPAASPSASAEPAAPGAPAAPAASGAPAAAPSSAPPSAMPSGAPPAPASSAAPVSAPSSSPRP